MTLELRAVILYLLLLQLPQDEQNFVLEIILTDGSIKAMVKKLDLGYRNVRKNWETLLKN